ncbi:LPS export ABC transporter periplasmic protein LptC [Candidatus Pelagibacter sp.]|nr:LPS export ABC transporter periplasmic protein LptC [Candidatus Pelagibacter sp.]
MKHKKIGKFFFILLSFIIILIVLNSKFFQNKDRSELKSQESESELESQESENEVYSSNKIKDVKYTTKDNDGNEYTVTASEGEIDYTNQSVIYLTKVEAFIKLVNSDNITITSNYGKYNSENFDTIFSKNVKANYLDNKIAGEYLDFSLKRNSMLISKKVVYTNLENILKADVIEINIKTKDTKIFMLENNKKVNIKSKN